MRQPRESIAGRVVGGGPELITALGGAQHFSGSAIGGFSSSNKVQSATNVIQDFRPGMTLWLVYQSIGVGATSTEMILGSCDSTANNGWRLTRQASTGTLYILSTSAGVLSFHPMNTPTNGINVACFVWKASDSTFNYLNNGGAFTSVGAITAPAAASSTWTSGIGTPLSSTDGSVPLVSGRILAYAIWNSEATTIQAQQYTSTTGNRLALPSAITSVATVDFNAGRDFSNGASSIVTQGSSPITMAVTGSPLLYPCDETRYQTSSSLKYYFDTGISLPTTDTNGNKYTIHDSYSHVKCVTDSLVLSVETYNNCTTQSANCYIGVYTNSSYVTSINNVQVGTSVTLNALPGAGTGKTVDLIEAGQAMQGANDVFPYVRGGVFINAVRLPKYLFDGATSANSSMILPTPVQKKLVLLGDSIMTGFFVNTFPSQTITQLLRADYPTSGTGGVVGHVAGSDSIGNVASTTALVNQTVSQLVAELNGTVSNTLWIQLGTNDYGASVIPVTNFQTYYGNLLDALHIASPNTVVICQSPIQRISPSTEASNGYGTLGAYRTAINTVASARSSYCTYVEGAAAAIVSNANMYSDGIHLTTAGDAQYKAFIKTTLGY